MCFFIKSFIMVQNDQEVRGTLQIIGRHRTYLRSGKTNDASHKIKVMLHLSSSTQTILQKLYSGKLFHVSHSQNLFFSSSLLSF